MYIRMHYNSCLLTLPYAITIVSYCYSFVEDTITSDQCMVVTGTELDSYV